MNKHLLSALCIFVAFATTAQLRPTVLSADSVLLFRTDEDALKRGVEIPKTRGFVASIRPNDAGGFGVSVFKQYYGYFMPDKATAPKGLVAGRAVMPGLAQYTVQEGAFTPGKEKAFGTMPNPEATYAYKFLDITSLNGGVFTEGNVAISTNETAGNYTKLLQLLPQELEFGGATRTTRLLYLKPNNEVAYQKSYAAFEPFTAQHFTSNKKDEEKAFRVVINPQRKAFFKINDHEMLFLGPLKDQKASISSVDTTGKITVTEQFEVAANHEFIASCYALSQTTAAMTNTNDIQNKVGFVLLYSSAATNYKSDTEYELLRFDAKGKLLFRHKFTGQLPDYGFMSANVFANEQDVFVKLQLRKGLKVGLFHIKATAEGVAYHTRWENDKTVKVFTHDGLAASGGASDDRFIVSLPDGELLLGGYDLISDQFRGYGFTHFDAAGTIKNYYNAATLTPSGLRTSLASLNWLTLADGRLVLIVNEARDNAGVAFQKYSLLNTAFSDKFTYKITPGNEVVFGSSVVASTQPTVVKTGSKFLDKMANNALGLSDPTAIPVEQIQINEQTKGYSPSFYVVDTKAEKIQRTDLYRLGYSLDSETGVWYNKEQETFTAFLKTAEQPLKRTKGKPTYPVGVFLKTVQVKIGN
jgi:hypothetical protein